eukprot:CAMPEP_0197016932 /NCGR_PEP_ID=MMETSP1380-20130617/79254_1 /TAXON_ID=5936 /ORGANISM="Euplotes crassus, Strain CT5" /LENGTH=161 /DNA_ID=CAMNT_0042443961 /DNA_START=892 /DNA_END=1374 /DNA_ORIENTATION=+
MKKFKNTTFSKGMDYQFLQEVGRSSGIWVRMNSREENRPLKGTIVRKPLSFYERSYENMNTRGSSLHEGPAQASSFSYNSTERSRTNEFSTRRSRMRNTSYSGFPMSAAEADQYEGIEVVGRSKLEAETLYVKSIRDKVLMKNHILNDDGEGEPTHDEEEL